MGWLYADRGWPDDTPSFLRDHLHTFLLATERADRTQRTVRLANDQRRDLHLRTRHHLDIFWPRSTLQCNHFRVNRSNPDHLATYLYLLLHRIEACASAVSVPLSVIHALALAGAPSEALGIASTLPNLGARMGALRIIAGALLRLNRPAKVQEVAERACQVATQIRNENQRASELANIGSILMHAGLLEQAWQAIKLIDESWFRDHRLSDVAASFAADGQPETTQLVASRSRTKTTEPLPLTHWQLGLSMRDT